MNEAHSQYKREVWGPQHDNGRSLPPGFLTFQGRADRRDSGFYSFQESLKYYGSRGSELWVCYATPNTLVKPTDATKQNVEMLVSLMTHPDTPFVVHMGISRSFQYMIKAWEEHPQYTRRPYESGNPNFPLHRDLAIKLHAFGAKVLGAIHQDKTYMISAPVPTMQEIFTKKLPAGTVWIGDTLTYIEQHKGKLSAELERLRAQLEEQDTRIMFLGWEESEEKK